MSLNATKRLIESLDLNINDEVLGNPYVRGHGVIASVLCSEGFKPITQADSPRKLAFIDGGNQEILGAPNFSIQLNRICSSLWQGTKRVSNLVPRKVEFFSATYSTIKNDEIFYDTQLFPLSDTEKSLPNDADLSFNASDRSLMKGNQRADISNVVGIARRFSELVVAKEVVENQLARDDIIVLDGTLQTAFPNENKYLEKLSAAAKSKGVVLAGLSKTSSIFTDTGYSLLGALDKLSPTELKHAEWYYPIVDLARSDHYVVLLGVKLNSITDRIFRFEIDRDQYLAFSELEIDEILTQLVRNSTDFTFPGYPYGLIDVDRFARVSKSELQYHRALFFSQMAETNKSDKFRRHVNAADAHDLLNTLG